ncbi:hypothetical protein BGW38_008289 [Lunasporangiospora selenospora]|uniref:Chromatin target of PRMT1 protein C-terminal domain-containing protein n=1 Tax=Lunasporangiospora selenospora TaxID=979761 RepID=A0A9P6FXY5_9FUNG|nr:hypothetical protein BGW38_008289 [Lunasporangiospora selenospora]
MSSHQSGQILYLSGSHSTQGSPGGSLSTRFQKLAQARNSGITVVNQKSTALESRPGRSLGLGFGTGSHPTGNSGQRITTDGSRPPKRSGAAGPPLGHGLHTASGLARAMQERGGGVTDTFLLNPQAHLVGTHQSNQNSRGGKRDRGGVLRGAGVTHANNNNSPNGNKANHNTHNTRASQHKALVLGTRPGKKQAGKATAAPAPAPMPNKTKAGKKATAAASLKSAQGPKPTTKPGGKEKKKPKQKATSESLDSELTAYMMKNQETATSVLDNDLDAYMAERPEEW